MKTITQFKSVLGLMAVLTLGGCANMNGTPYPPNPNVAGSGGVYPGHGVVHSVELVPQENSGIAGSSIGIGTIAGAVIGGVIGNQVGSGRGNTVATVAGAAGGAYVGHELENRQQQKSDTYKVTVRMDDGSYQASMQSASADFRVGDRVRFKNGSLQRY